MFCIFFSIYLFPCDITREITVNNLKLVNNVLTCRINDFMVLPENVYPFPFFAKIHDCRIFTYIHVRVEQRNFDKLFMRSNVKSVLQTVFEMFLFLFFFLIRPVRSFYCLSSALFSSWLCVRTSSGHLPTRTSYPPCAANTAVSAARSASSSTVLELVSRSL